MEKQGKSSRELQLAQKYLTPEEFERYKNLPPLSEKADKILDIMAELLADDFYSKQEVIND